MKLTDTEKEAILAAAKIAEAIIGAEVPPPFNLLLVGAIRTVEEEINADLDPDTVEELRAGVYDRLQAKINARFAHAAPAAPPDRQG